MTTNLGDLGLAGIFLEMSSSRGLVFAPTELLTYGFSFLDRSGSMSQFGTMPRDAFAEGLAILRKSPNADHIVTALFTFGDDVRTEIAPCLVKSARAPEVIGPGGNTFLYGAVRAKLEIMVPSYREAVRRGFCSNIDIFVYSDGEDNRSTDEDQKRLRLLAAEARAAGWGLYTNAFGHDAKSIAQDMGFPDDDEHAVNLAATVQAVRSATIRSATLSVMSSTRSR